MNQNATLMLSAVVLSAAVLVGSLMLRSSVDSLTDEIAEVRSGLTEAQEAFAAGSAPARPARQRARKPDPDRRHSVDIAGSPAIGPESAKVTIVEFADFQCPFCVRAGPTLKQVLRAYPEDVRIVFKHLPLSIHPQAPGAHAASEAAHRQGKFWEFHDLVYENPRALSDAQYASYAEQLGLDVEQFKQDLASPPVKGKVDADMAEARRLGVSGTPAFFINGRYLSGAQPFDAFKAMIDEELAG